MRVVRVKHQEVRGRCRIINVWDDVKGRRLRWHEHEERMTRNVYERNEWEKYMEGPKVC